MKKCGSIKNSNGLSQLRELFFWVRSLRTSATALDKFLAVVLIALGVCAGGYFLDSLQTGLADVRRRLDPSDHDAAIRGRDIMNLHKAILVGSALVVVWAVFKLP